jgi:hypothetical protein
VSAIEWTCVDGPCEGYKFVAEPAEHWPVGAADGRTASYRPGTAGPQQAVFDGYLGNGSDE